MDISTQEVIIKTMREKQDCLRLEKFELYK